MASVCVRVCMHQLSPTTTTSFIQHRQKSNKVTPNWNILNRRGNSRCCANRRIGRHTTNVYSMRVYWFVYTKYSDVERPRRWGREKKNTGHADTHTQRWQARALSSGTFDVFIKCKQVNNIGRVCEHCTHCVRCDPTSNECGVVVVHSFLSLYEWKCLNFTLWSSSIVHSKALRCFFSSFACSLARSFTYNRKGE